MTRKDIQFNSLAEAYKVQIIDQLETIFDPEIGIDIYNLGLVYQIKLDENQHCEVSMTFTSSSCTCSETLPQELKEKLSNLPFIESVEVIIVWEPTWQLEQISYFGRIALGINPN